MKWHRRLSIPFMTLLIVISTGCSPLMKYKGSIPYSLTSLPYSIGWHPEPGMTYQIQFSGEIDLSIDAQVYELDAFDTNAAAVDRLHQDGRKVICYINAGSVEDWRPDADQFPQEVIGNAYSGWPGENWLDIRRLDLLMPILEARLQMCRAKGFDGVEFDNMDGYQNDTGFDLTASDQLAFNRWLADAAHAQGLAVGLKNDPDQIADLEPWFDFVLLESCFEQGWCEQAQPFIDAGKAVIDIEYTSIVSYCESAEASSISLIEKEIQPDAFLRTCP